MYLLLLCDAMYDFVYLFVRRSVRDSHWSRDYREGTRIRVFYENPGFYMVGQESWKSTRTKGGLNSP
jgi:hypothetical protein